MFNTTIDDDILYLLSELGHNCKINGKKDSKLIVNNTSSTLNDDKRIISDQKLVTGDYIYYANQYFIVGNEIVDERYRSYYKGNMTTTPFRLRWIKDGKLIVFPTSLQYGSGHIVDGIIKLPVGEVIALVQQNDYTDEIQIGNRFILGKFAYVVEDIDFTRVGLYSLQLSKSSISDIDDLENGVANRWDKTTGNDLLTEIPDDFDKPIFEDDDKPVTPPEINKEELTNAILLGKEKINDDNDYTSETLKALIKAINDGELVLNNDKATQDEVDKATNDIKQAIDNLVIVEPEPEPEPEPEVDKTELESALEDAYAKLEDGKDYTDESIEDLNNAISLGEKTLHNGKATQQQVNDATREILKAITNLKEKEDIPFKDFRISGRDTLGLNKLSKYTALGTEGKRVEWTIDHRDIADFHSINGNECTLRTSYYNGGIVTLTAIIPGTKPLVQVDKEIMVGI